MTEKDILKVIPLVMTTKLLKDNLKKKKKNDAIDIMELGVRNIVGVSLIKETSDFIEDF